MYKKIISMTLFMGALTTTLNATNHFSYGAMQDPLEVSVKNRYTLEVVSQKMDPQGQPLHPLVWNARVIGLDDKNRMEGLRAQSTDPLTSKDTLHFVIFRGVNLEVRLGEDIVLHEKNFKVVPDLQVGQKVYCSSIAWVPSLEHPGDLSVSYEAQRLSTEIPS